MFRAIYGLLMALSIWVLASAEAELGLVAHYAFDDGQGTVARDSSGNGLHGRILGGVKWAKIPVGGALELDGRNGYVDCGKNFSHHIENAATLMLWCRPATLHGGLINWSVGGGNLDERLVLGIHTYRPSILTGVYLSDGKRWQSAHSEPLKADEWTHLILTFDGNAVSVYRDAILVTYSRQAVMPNITDIPLWLGRCQGMGKEYFHGLVDEVRIYNRALSLDEVRSNYLRDAAARGKDTGAFERMNLQVVPRPAVGKIVVALDASGMYPLPGDGRFAVDLLTEDSRPVQKVEIPRIPANRREEAVLDVRALRPGRYRIRAAVVAADGETVGKPAEAAVSWAGVPAAFRNVKLLNNLVWEFVNVEADAARPLASKHSFNLPCDRWVFFRAVADVPADGIAWVGLDRTARSAAIFVHGVADAGKPLEAMRFLKAGEHAVFLGAQGQAVFRRLVVRAIPALGFCKFGYHPRVGPYGPYDWAYLDKHVAPHVNYIVGAGSDNQNDIVKEWKGRGKKWLIECGVPGFVNAPKDITTAEGAYKYWASHRAFTDPLIDGGLADEFLTRTPKEKYEVWTEAVRLLAKDEKLRGKKLYPYCTGTLPTLDHCRKFVEAAIETGGTIAWERYQIEKPTEEGARSFIEAQLKHSLLVWEKAIPDCRKHMIIVLGYLCTITAETQSIYPSVDFKYYLDMQCHLIANDPTFEGLYGLQTYTSGYADDETVRWICRLFRHYFIEGNTEMLSKRYGLKYNPAHLKNPDFADGMKGWDVRSAEEGSVATKSQPGYARMQGRMGTSFGDQFLWTKRSEKRPNVIRQKAVGLVPGKLYSLKLVTGNYDELQAGKSKKVRHGVSVTIDNVTMVNEKSFIHIQPNLYCYFIPPFSATNSFWFNHHHYVFRAKGEAATVTIMDWQNEKEPGAPIGQELMFNFVEMQPYYGEE